MGCNREAPGERGERLHSAFGNPQAVLARDRKAGAKKRQVEDQVHALSAHHEYLRSVAPVCPANATNAGADREVLRADSARPVQRYLGGVEAHAAPRTGPHDVDRARLRVEYLAVHLPYLLNPVGLRQRVQAHEEGTTQRLPGFICR